MTKYNILYLIPSLNSGGSEKNLIEVMNYVVQNNFNVFIITKEAKMKNFINGSVKIFYWKKIGSKNPFWIFLNAYKLSLFAKKHSINLMHPKSRAPTWSVYIFFLFQKQNVKFITTVHGMHSCNTFFRKFYSQVITKGQKVIAVSQFIGDYILDNYSINPNKLVIIERGIDTRVYSYKNVTPARLFEMAKYFGIQDDTRKVIFFPGRISSIKGQEFVIEAINRIPTKDFICIMAGDFSKNIALKNKIIDKIIKYNLESNIKLVNNISDIQAAYTLSHVVLCLSSKPEAFGRIIIEANACGRPVIATKIGAMQYTVSNCLNGWFVESNNIEDLVEKLSYALSLGEKEWLDISKFCIDYVNNYYHINNVFKKTIDLYHELLEK